MEALFKFYEDLPRQGPGNRSATLHALSFIQHRLPEQSDILDVGCGSGAQTLVLAETLAGRITAVDIYQPYLNILQNAAAKIPKKASIECQVQDMSKLPFPDSSFDLIWSEGAVYIMGVEQALMSWSRILKPQSYIVLSEMTWMKENPDRELVAFWKRNYPQMTSVQGNIKRFQKNGYRVISHFPLAAEIWWGDFYQPIQDKIKRLGDLDAVDEEIRLVINECEEEMDMFRRYASFYGYEFYIAVKKS